ncbi:MULTISPECIES: hypothetical protein [Frankia]|nr:MULTISPECIES: hypothetical protein [Frankia]
MRLVMLSDTHLPVRARELPAEAEDRRLREVVLRRLPPRRTVSG